MRNQVSKFGTLSGMMGNKRTISAHSNPKMQGCRTGINAKTTKYTSCRKLTAPVYLVLPPAEFSRAMLNNTLTDMQEISSTANNARPTTAMPDISALQASN